MNSNIRIAVLTACALGTILVLGCPTEEDETEPMTHLLEAFSSELAELDTVVQAHGTAVASAADLAAVQAELETFIEEAHHHHEAMEHGVEEMGSCSNDGTPPDTDHLASMVEDLMTELMAHEMAIGGAADLAEAQAEEDDHQAEMTTILDECQEHSDELETTAADFSCPAGHHDD